MYNRYIRNDDSETYTRVSQEAAPPPYSRPIFDDGSSENEKNSAEDFISKILGRVGLKNVDTGDILLLLILFFLFSEKGDEELMIALGLLLIL